jgi:hypothetical protein
MSFSQSKFVLRLMLAAIFSCSAMTCLDAVGQEYAELEVAAEYFVDPDAGDSKAEKQKNKDAKNAIKDGEKAVQAILTSGGNVAAPEVKAYFDGYVFPSMTQAANLANAGKMRSDFDRDFLGTKFTRSNRVPLINNIILPGLQKIVDDDKLSPAARVNAVVLMSRLDDTPLVRISKTPPKPSLTAFDALLAIWQGNNYPEFLKASALSGILRHVEVDSAISSARIPADRNTGLMRSVTGMLDNIIADDPKLEIDLNRWKVSKAIRLMSTIRLPAETQSYYDRMVVMLDKDSTIPKWVKLEAVRGITRLVSNGFNPTNLPTLLESSATFVSQALKEEATAIEESVDELVYDNILWDNADLEATGTNYTDNPQTGMGGDGMGMGMGMGGPGMGMGMGGPGMGGGAPGRGAGAGFGGVSAEEEIKPIVELPNFKLNLARRRMKLVAASVQELIAQKAIVDGAAEPHKDERKKLDKRIDDFMIDSNVGIIDLARVDEDEVQKESYTMQLKKVCEMMSADAADFVSRMRGEQPADRTAPAAEADAAVGAPPFGG